MDAPTRIVTDLDDATFVRVEAAAAQLGMTPEQFAADALRRALDDAIDVDEWLQEGRDQIARGDYQGHDTFMTDLQRWRKTRVRPS